ncbi:helix-turn-helix domain-containing protein [Citrobacter portucalensis]|uniref:helix-turn-helix domain-containing protein n=1 Tax=Citrobacter portucalensis TaxID=1639133 RepID=UPI00226B7F2A|nr:helix-turn-helix domain-containing protein [Citrobacter portucalensis]MCX8976538.1 helix-turn-helix domain-containing protein [Citrobacter portucalensis]
MNLMAKAMSIKVGNPLRKLVLIKLADNANDKGECWPSYQHIADHCECSKTAVRNHIDALEEMGLLKRENRIGVANGKGNTSNVYYLNLDATPVPLKSTGLCNHVAPPMPPDGTPPMPPDGTRTSHSFEPVNEPNSLSGREGFMSEAAKRRIGISPGGEIPLPPMFKPNEEHIAMAREKGVSIETELLNFRDYHTARGTMLIDWNSAFRVWIRNARVNPLTRKQRSEPETPHWNSREGWEDFL